MIQKLFHERVLPSPGFYAMFLLLPIAIWIVFLPLNIAFGIFLAIASYLVVILVSVWFAPQTIVTNENLQVGAATLPRSSIGQVKPIDASDAFEERGVLLSALAFTKFQFGVKTLVKIYLDDIQDQTPYWLISTRRPSELVTALGSKNA